MCTQTNIRKPLIGSSYFGLVTKSNEGLERVPVYMSRCSVQHSLEMIMPLHFYLCELMISSRKAIFSFFFSLQGKVYVIRYPSSESLQIKSNAFISLQKLFGGIQVNHPYTRLFFYSLFFPLYQHNNAEMLEKCLHFIK